MSMELVTAMSRMLAAPAPRAVMPSGEGLERLAGEVRRMGLRSAASCLTTGHLGGRGLKDAAEFVLVNVAQSDSPEGNLALVRLYEIIGDPIQRIFLTARSGIAEGAPWAGEAIEPLARAARERKMTTTTSLYPDFRCEGTEKTDLQARLASLGFDPEILPNVLRWNPHPQWQGVSHTSPLFRDRESGTMVIGIAMAPFTVYPEHLHVGIKSAEGDKGEAVLFLPGSGPVHDWQGSYAKTDDYGQVRGSIHTPWTGPEAAAFLGIAWGGVVMSGLPGTEFADLAAASGIEGALLSDVFSGVPVSDQKDLMDYAIRVMRVSLGEAGGMHVTTAQGELLGLTVHPAERRAGLARRHMAAST